MSFSNLISIKSDRGKTFGGGGVGSTPIRSGRVKGESQWLEEITVVVVMFCINWGK